MTFKSKIKMLVGVAAAAVVLLSMSAYTVDAGHYAVIKRWGKAIDTSAPGLHFRIPIVDSLVLIDVRQLKHEFDLNVETQDTLLMRAVMSVIWSIDPAKLIKLINEFGSPQHVFDYNITPRVGHVSRKVIGSYSASELNENRDQIALAVREDLKSRLDDIPIIITRSHLKNFELPALYRDKITEKESAKQKLKKTQEELKRYEVEIQTTIQSAEVEAQEIKLAADASYYKDLQEAKGLLAVGKAIHSNPNILNQLINSRWVGKMPKITGTSGEVNLLVGNDLGK